MKTAKLLKKLSGFRGDARLYELSDEGIGGLFNDDTRFKHVVVSGISNEFGVETYVFGANEAGEVLNWCELDGSFEGDIDHRQALNNAGYELER